VSRFLHPSAHNIVAHFGDILQYEGRNIKIIVSVNTTVYIGPIGILATGQFIFLLFVTVT